VSVDQNRAIARRYIDEFWSRGNVAAVDELIATDYVVHDPGTPGRAGGTDGEKQVHAMYRSVFPDLRFSVDDVLGEGDRAVVRWTARGTHRGELLGIAPTGKLITIPGTSIVRIANGKIAEHWLNWDTVGMLQQMGAIPAPQQPATA
jgi:steroid delta-isomerase-like uncharacterized protein